MPGLRKFMAGLRGKVSKTCYGAQPRFLGRLERVRRGNGGRHPA